MRSIKPFIPTMIRRILLLNLFVFFSSFLPAQTAKEIIEKMLISISQTKTVTYSSVLTERINGELQVAENKIKLHVLPFKSYVYLPKTGIEVLYVQGKNDNKAIVKPNKFPFVNLNIDVQSSLLRNKQHHSINELGFTYFGEIISSDISKAGVKYESRILYKGMKKWENYDCYVITIENPDFEHIKYTVKPNETVLNIAKRFKVSEYMILENNKEISNYQDVKAGQTIKIPNYYSKKSILYIDKKTQLPVLKAIFDDKGLFEKYEYKNLIKNPILSEEEFSTKYKDYGF